MQIEDKNIPNARIIIVASGITLVYVLAVIDQIKNPIVATGKNMETSIYVYEALINSLMINC